VDHFLQFVSPKHNSAIKSPKEWQRSGHRQRIYLPLPETLVVQSGHVHSYHKKPLGLS